MLKNEMIGAVANKIDGATKKDISVVIDALTDVIKEAVLAGDTVTIPEVCKISSKEVPERTGTTKLGGVEKSWVKPAGKVAVVKALPGFKNIFEV
ncbi:MAG: HU family DNA-binding protein [Eubacterium sp.]